MTVTQIIILILLGGIQIWGFIEIIISTTGDRHRAPKILIPLMLFPTVCLLVLFVLSSIDVNLDGKPRPKEIKYEQTSITYEKDTLYKRIK